MIYVELGMEIWAAALLPFKVPFHILLSAIEGSSVRTTLSPHALLNGTKGESAQSFRESFLEHSKGLIHTRTSLLYVANNRCCEIRSVSENQFLHRQQQGILSPDSLSYMASAAFPSDKGF